MAEWGPRVAGCLAPSSSGGWSERKGEGKERIERDRNCSCFLYSSVGFLQIGEAPYNRKVFERKL